MPPRTTKTLRFATCLNCGRSIPPEDVDCICHDPEHIFTDTDTGEPMIPHATCETPR